MILFLQIAHFDHVFSQSIGNFIAETRLDSIVKTVRVLSGEDSSYINGIKTIIANRKNTGNNLAADYILERLKSYHLISTDQKYSSGGRNIFARQTGLKYPGSIYIICAHYDAVTSYCADDNASGVAAVIEVARILSGKYFDFTIVYALWDEEEIGLFGSNYYAQQANLNNENILGVINLDMLGYDSNNDKKFDIHTNNFPNSLLLKDSLVSIVTGYGLSLIPNVINPGTTYSDHSSFWNQNYGAVVFGESFFGGDNNPSYHTSNDRINLFNLPYFTELTKLSVGMLASLAVPSAMTLVNENNDDLISAINIYPNPTNGVINISKRDDNELNIQVVDVFGRLIISKIAGNHIIPIDLSNCKQGVYYVILTSKHTKTIKLVIKN
jgi:hypothetical protein